MAHMLLQGMEIEQLIQR